MTDTDMKYIRLYLEENYDLTSEKKIIDAADLAAHQNSYHPVRDFLNSLTWDGTERIRYCLHHFLGAEADEYTFHAFDEPKQWEIREINEIMNQCVTGWTYFSNPRSFAGYGRQKGWEREKTATGSGNQNTEIPDGFVEITEQMELPF